MSSIINRLSAQARNCRDRVTLVQQYMAVNPDVQVKSKEFADMSYLRTKLDDLIYEIEVNLPKHMEMCKNKKG